MNNNWESLIRAIVPLSFMAIWALTSLFNRESKPKPINRPTPRPDLARGGMPPRGGEPTMRFPSSPGPSSSTLPARRPPVRGRDDDGIVILSSETNRLDREREKRNNAAAAGMKRANRGKPLVPSRKPEPAANSSSAPNSTRTKLAGVSQNVNQHLANTNLELAPLAAMPAMPTLGLTGTTPAAAVAVVSPSGSSGSRSAATLGLADPVRLREAFVLNEILQPPVSMRSRRVGPAPPH